MTPSHRRPTLLAISDRRLIGGRAGLATWVRSLPGDVALALREKDLDRNALVEAGRAVRSVFPGTLVIHGDLQAAVDCQADGVHLPASAPWAELAPAVRDEDLLLGVSTHNKGELAEACAIGADYVLFGPVFATPAKRRFGPAQGLDELCRAAEVGRPVLAVGGIDPENATLVASTGAAGIAAIRAFADAKSAASLAAAWRRATATIAVP